MEQSNYISVAIDGPGGAGKSTLAARLSAHYGWCYADTGAVYRAVGLAVLNAGIDSTNPDAVGALLGQISVELRFDSGVQHTLLNGEDVSGEIRRDLISRYASNVSAFPAVRAFLLELQRGLARSQNVIMDGRDIGTVVLPNATVKIFLTAAPEIRAERRRLELLRRGECKTFDEVLAAIMQRDNNDSNRAAAPLRRADDAILLDTSELDEDAAFHALAHIIDRATNNR